MMLKNRFFRQLLASFVDLLPILTVVVIFQLFVIRQPIPDLAHLLLGMVSVALGLTLFVQGLELSLFPLGEAMAYAFARKGSLVWLLVFAFCLGFGASIAEPALLAICDEAARVAGQAHTIAATDEAKASYALGLRVTVSLSVGFAVLVGVLRIIRGWPVYYPMFCGYLGVLALTPFAPKDIVGIAYDSGNVATSTLTVPLATALGVGLATAIKGRNPVVDGFGLIAFASLAPTFFVLLYGVLR